MIDYTKIFLIGIDKKTLLNSSRLDFKTCLVEKTGELSTKQIAEYHCCKITVHDNGVILFTGSIHKMWNSLKGLETPNYKNIGQNNGYNGNQFTINDILEVRIHLKKLFNCAPEQMIFQNIEFGINTTPSFNPQQFINGLLYHNGVKFEYKYNEHFAQAIHQRYFIKIYNKSNQYGMDEYTLRVELKVIKTEDIKHLGIKTFADINTANLQKANELLLKRFNEVVYYDNTIAKKKLSERQKQALEKYSNDRYWINDLKPKNRVYNKLILQGFIENYSEQLQNQITKNIIQKFSIINRLSKTSKIGIINRLPETPKFDIINYSSIELKTANSTSNNKTRICPISKADISMQREDSFLLSNTGLKHLKKHSKEQFNLLAGVLLTGNDNKYEKNIYSRMSKQIRNRYFSNRSLYAENQQELF